MLLNPYLEINDLIISIQFGVLVLNFIMPQIIGNDKVICTNTNEKFLKRTKTSMLCNHARALGLCV